MYRCNISVIHVMAYAPPYMGNFIRSLVQLEKEMAKISLGCVYVLPEAASKMDWVESLIAEGKKIYFFPEGYRNLFRHSQLLSWLVKKENVRIIHTHFWPPKYAMVVKSIQWRHPELEIVWHHHNHYGVHSSFALMRLIKKAVLYIGTHGAWHIGVSQSVASDLIDCRFKKERVFAVVNAVDFSHFDKDVMKTRKELKINPESRIVLMFGFDFNRKGVDIAIRAFSDIEKERNIILAIVVTANMKHVKEEISRLFGSIPPWIKLLPPRDDVASYYKMADIFLSCSREEGYCYALVEAAYCGCMLIASNIPGQNELAIPHTIEYPVEDSLALQKSALRVLARSPMQIQQIREDQKEYVVRQYKLEHWASQIISVYRTMTPHQL